LSKPNACQLDHGSDVARRLVSVDPIIDEQVCSRFSDCHRNSSSSSSSIQQQY